MMRLPLEPIEMPKDDRHSHGYERHEAAQQIEPHLPLGPLLAWHNDVHAEHACQERQREHDASDRRELLHQLWRSAASQQRRIQMRFRDNSRERGFGVGLGLPS